MFVGNLAFEATQSEVEELFSQAGSVVEVFLPMDRATGRPRGFAFVEFEDQDAVDKAIAQFNGHELRGRALRVNEAEDRPPRAPRSFSQDGPGAHYSGPPPSRPKGSRRNLRRKKRSL